MVSELFLAVTYLVGGLMVPWEGYYLNRGFFCQKSLVTYTSGQLTLRVLPEQTSILAQNQCFSTLVSVLNCTCNLPSLAKNLHLYPSPSHEIFSAHLLPLYALIYPLKAFLSKNCSQRRKRKYRNPSPSSRKLEIFINFFWGL